MRLNPVYPAYYLWLLGHAYYLLKQHDKAIEVFERVLNLNPDWWPSHVYSAICYAELGRIEDAQSAAEKILEAQPTFSVEHWQTNVPYKNQEDVDRWVTGLRKIGLK